VITSSALGFPHAVAPGAGHWTELAALVVANGLATVLRFAVLRLRIAPAAAA